jgi:hypothetical protein
MAMEGPTCVVPDSAVNLGPDLMLTRFVASHKRILVVLLAFGAGSWMLVLTQIPVGPVSRAWGVAFVAPMYLFFLPFWLLLYERWLRGVRRPALRRVVQLAAVLFGFVFFACLVAWSLFLMRSLFF